MLHSRPPTTRVFGVEDYYCEVYRAHDNILKSSTIHASKNVEISEQKPALLQYLSQFQDRHKGKDGNLSEISRVPVRSMDGFKRITECRNALDALDRRGWKRSFFQRKFHDQFIRATAKIFWKMEGAGQFARDHQRVLEVNGWDHLSQEILISTPRRFGKTISVSMFAAALVYSAAAVEVSIYSTCKRISQKLLRNICKFLELIYLELKVAKHKVIRCNMEEIVLQGPEGDQDIRVVNSYPSKVNTFICFSILRCI